MPETLGSRVLLPQERASLVVCDTCGAAGLDNSLIASTGECLWCYARSHGYRPEAN
jgi:hypothetical protein